MKRWFQMLIVALVAVSLVPSAARAQSDSFASAGFRVGLGIDPDQFVFGAQAALGRWTITRFVPSIDVGVGDNVTTVDFNGDLLLRVAIPDAAIEFYGGGGPTVAYFNPDGGNDHWELGLSLVVGSRLPLRTQQAFNLEARFGVGDIPDFRLLLGILF